MVRSIGLPAFPAESEEREKAPYRRGNSTAPQIPRTPRSMDGKTLPCPYDDCQKTFNRQARLREHLRSHTDERIFECPEDGCSKNFLRESHLKAHMKSAHSGIRDYTCSWDGCGKGFATGTRLRRHEKTHEEKEKYRCRGYEGCDAVFRKHATLNQHILSVHQGIKPFPCRQIDDHTGEECKMAFETAEKLRAHQRAKHDDTRYTCTECLDRAMQNQDNGETFQSNTSDYSFPSYALLQSHIAMLHPPACPHCPHVSSTRRELKRHIELAHGPTDPESSDIKLFPCTYSSCDRVFTKRGNLTVHIKSVHEGRKEFICGTTDLSSSVGIPGDVVVSEELEACGRSFTSKSSLEEHVRTSHLGIRSRRAERKSKRKAEMQATATGNPSLEDQDQDQGKMIKRRTTRTRRARRPEPSTFSQLTGIPDRDATASFDFNLPGYSEAATTSWSDEPEHQQLNGLDSILHSQYRHAIAADLDPGIKIAGTDFSPLNENDNESDRLDSMAMAIDPHLLAA